MPIIWLVLWSPGASAGTQITATAKAPGPVVGAGAHIPQPAAIGPVVQQQR